MHKVTLHAIGVETSSLGMGCASLGSRVSAAQGQQALARAWAAGVRWFDVAPAYGGGEAEMLLGAFLAERGADRDQAQICTKVGLLPPPQNPAKKLLRAALRPASRALSPMRAMIRKSGATANRRLPLTPDILKNSLEQSLKRLNLEQVTLYALHNADPQDLERDEILRVLEDLTTSGKARALAVAGDGAAALAAARIGTPFSAVQLAHPVADQAPLTTARTAGLDVITHSVFGVAGELAHLERRLRQDTELLERLRSANLAAPQAPLKELAAAALLARARACNPDGVVLCSMYSKRSLEQNIKAAQEAARPVPILE
ncbi:aldo/keto reductase [Epibacterium ulvae]|uniref:aldo/keto reductase n=1 Tax=Epibacterium ulvae TaxID=1156985 RepID=UPI001BFC03B3|nr:aldo/keto reductase [Epibacterium ulvae]MBT8154543.1 aldo/keto reductase [Epibacterium ulvae]